MRYAHKVRNAMRRYRLTLDEFERLWVLQGGLCALCGEPAKDKNTLVIDHCHSTGVVRGFIHRTCNLLIGYADENSNLLEKAIAYIKKHKEVSK